MSATRQVSGGLSDEVIDGLNAIAGPKRVFTGKAARLNRTRVPATFPVHRWEELMPDVVVLPRTTEEVAEVLKLANRFRIPVVPRAGGTGLVDGAVPLRKGILLDLKAMDQILEVDTHARTVTVQPGINLQTLNQALAPTGMFFPDFPGSYPCALVGGRLGTNGWSMLAGRYGHMRNLIVSMEVVLPTGDVIEVHEGGRKVRKTSNAIQLKQLFIGHQGTLGVATEITLELVPRPEVEFAATFGVESFEAAYEIAGEATALGLASLAGLHFEDDRKIDFISRETPVLLDLAVTPGAMIGAVFYGVREEVRAAGRRLMQTVTAAGGEYLGDAFSQIGRATWHDVWSQPLKGRLPDGQVVPMSWHEDDAGMPYPGLPAVRKEWHEIIARYTDELGVIDDWGVSFYTSGNTNTGGDYTSILDVGIWEEKIDEAFWEVWVECKREIAQVALKHGGTISGAHGGTRAGDVELLPQEMGEGQFALMLDIKRLLDPNNVMNPGKYLMDRAYEGLEAEGVTDDGLQVSGSDSARTSSPYEQHGRAAPGSAGDRSRFDETRRAGIDARMGE